MEIPKKDRIERIFSQRMRGFKTPSDGLQTVIEVISAVEGCTVEQAEAALEDALKIIKTMTRV